MDPMLGSRRGDDWRKIIVLGGAVLFILSVASGVAAQPTLTSGGGDGGGGGGGGSAVGFGGGRAGSLRCSNEHMACVRMAGPLLTDANLIFPDNMADVNKLCTRWREFVVCVKAYTGRCFSAAQQEEFVRAVQSPVGLAHRLCSEVRYQAEYLEYAFCIHSTVTGNGRCSSLYHQLVERVLGEVDEKTLCCSHRQFEDCVLDEVGRVCNSGKSDAVKTFAKELLDKAFNYIKNTCSDSDAYAQDCLPRHLEPSNRALNASEPSGRDGGAPRPPGDLPSQQPRTNHIPVLPHPEDEEGQSPWQPGKALDPGPHMVPAPPEVPDTQARTNPGRLPSHGRGINWAPTNARPANPDLASGGSQTPHEHMWTVSSANGSPLPSPNPTQAWYPWGKVNNVVDEPNQQGLAGKDVDNENSASTQRSVATVLFALTIAVILFN